MREPEPLIPQGESRPAIQRATREDVLVRDPSIIIDGLVRSIQRNLFADPQDRAGRIRRQISRFDDDTRQQILTRLETRLDSAQYAHLRDILSQSAPDEGQLSSPPAPEAATSDEETTASAKRKAPPTQRLRHRRTSKRPRLRRTKKRRRKRRQPPALKRPLRSRPPLKLRRRIKRRLLSHRRKTAQAGISRAR